MTKNTVRLPTRRPSNVPVSVWSELGELTRYNVSIGLLTWNNTKKGFFTNELSSPSTVRKKVTQKKGTKKKIRKVDWLKSLTTESLVMVSGNGSFEFSDGSKYSGQLKKGVFHGIGMRVWKDGTIYSGDWKNGVIQGHGRIVYPSGVEYIGSWKDGVKSGRGTMFRRNGTMFTGDWEDGLIKKPLLPIRPKFLTEEIKEKRPEKKTKKKPNYFGRPRPGQKVKPGTFERIEVLELSSKGKLGTKVEELLKKNYIWTLRDLTKYTPVEIIEMCSLSPKMGMKLLDQIRTDLRKYGLRLKSQKEEKFVDIRTLSPSESRRLRLKEQVQLDKLGIYYSKKYS